MNEIEIFKALADPTRLKILECIKNEEKCICEVIPYTGKSQPNVSLHLKTLKNAGLITERKDGTRIMLSIADKDVFKLIDIANKFKG
jgi:DNA-binding transcriptional ArsR family regulator